MNIATFFAEPIFLRAPRTAIYKNSPLFMQLLKNVKFGEITRCYATRKKKQVKLNLAKLKKKKISHTGLEFLRLQRMQQ